MIRFKPVEVIMQIKKCERHTDVIKDKNNRCKKCQYECRIKTSKKNKLYYVILKGGNCNRCGYNRSLAALDFHHKEKDSKSFLINSGTTTSREKSISELNFCELLCGNCHQQHHSIRYLDSNLELKNGNKEINLNDYPLIEINHDLIFKTETIQDNVCIKHQLSIQGKHCKKCMVEHDAKKLLIIKLYSIQKLGNKCKKCGFNRSIKGLNFHHTNNKEKMISKIKSITKIQLELNKCQLLCINCHREEHEKYYLDTNLNLVNNRTDLKDLISKYIVEPLSIIKKTKIKKEIKLKIIKIQKIKKMRIVENMSAEEIDKLTFLVKNNSLRIVGEIYKVSDSCIRKRCIKYNIYLPTQSERMLAKGKDYLQKNGIRLAKYNNENKDKNEKKKKWDYKAIAQFFNKKMTRKEIQDLLKIPKSSLKNIFNKLRKDNLLD